MKYPAKDLMHLDFCFHQCNDSRFYFPLPTKRTEQEGVVSCSSLQFSMLDLQDASFLNMSVCIYVCVSLTF